MLTMLLGRERRRLRGARPVSIKPYGYPVAVDGVPRAEVAVGDDLPGPGRARVKPVAGDGGLKAGSRRMQFAEQVRRSACRARSVRAYRGAGSVARAATTGPPRRLRR
jgi:hypothetical protein